MAGRILDAQEVLLVAARGAAAVQGQIESQIEGQGLWMWREGATGWQGARIDRAPDLTALCGHPHLPLVYATAGTPTEGRILAWHVGADGARPLGVADSGGAEPCALTVDPTGRLLIVTNYQSGTLALQRLGDDGRLDGPPALITLEGSGPERDRQEAAHPHQAFMAGDLLVVTDLGADLLRTYRVDPARPGAGALAAAGVTAMPPGSGPRHGVALPGGRLAVTGELGGTLLTGRPGAGDWAAVRSTAIDGPGRARAARNYPGDIARSADGRHVRCANRSHGTVATFDVSGPAPVLVAEIDTGTDWPQHIAPRPGALLVAGQDSGQVIALPLEGDIPQAPQRLFDCAGAGWLHVHRLR